MNIQKFNTQLTEAAKYSLSQLPKRSRDIIEKRFGVFRKEAKTLEAIGQEYGITRERVRQIEERALKDLRQISSSQPRSVAVLDTLKSHLVKFGHARKEETFMRDFHPAEKGALSLFLTLHPELTYIPENDSFYSRWCADEKQFKQSEKFVDGVIKNLEQAGQVMPEDSFAKVLKVVAAPVGLAGEIAPLMSYIDASKNISKNNFGEYGLVSWAEIKPRGLRDKAFIVLKKSGKPLHFREVAKAIEVSKLNSRPVHPQTVHNELIRDDRFVLVGRGLYALSDWGYSAGTVRDIIKSILHSEGPLAKAMVLQRVMEKRFVKENTILLNLQNKSFFRRLDDGRYHLKEV